MIDIKDLTFSYNDDTEIFTQLSLTIDQKTTAIIGQNGAGKSTLVKLLKGLLQPISGSITINNQALNQLTVKDIAAMIGLVFQNPNDQIFKSNVLEEVMFGPLQLGVNEQQSKLAALDALKEVALDHLIDENPYDLNLSERKLISIASILAMDTDIVIFDEPTIAQDAIGISRIENIIQRLQAEGKYVITIIHDMDFVARNFENTVIIANGKILFQGATREAFEQKEILEKARLDLPAVTNLGVELGLKETYLTIDELANKL